MANNRRVLQRYHILLSVALLAPVLVIACNKQFCSSIISKCLVNNECSCEIMDCTCCKDCFKCLGPHFTRCCDCLDMCPRRRPNFKSGRQQSYVGQLKGLHSMFSALTFEPYDEKWKVVETHVNVETTLNVETNEIETISKKCTVIFLNDCLSLNKCRLSCKSFGASGYRWFHDGCCECVGPTCTDHNFGIDENRCRHCPRFKRHYNEL